MGPTERKAATAHDVDRLDSGILVLTSRVDRMEARVSTLEEDFVNRDLEESEIGSNISDLDCRINTIQTKMRKEIDRSTKEIVHAEVAAHMLDVESRFAAIKTSVLKELYTASKEATEGVGKLERNQEGSKPSGGSVSCPLIKSRKETALSAQLLMAELITEKSKSSLEDGFRVLSDGNIPSSQDIHANDVFDASLKSTSVVEIARPSIVGLSNQPSGSDSTAITNNSSEIANISDFSVSGGISSATIQASNDDGAVTIEASNDDGGKKEGSFVGLSPVKIADSCLQLESNSLPQWECAEVTEITPRLLQTNTRNGSASFLIDTPLPRIRTAETPRKGRGSTGTGSRCSIAKDNWSHSPEPPRRTCIQRWENGLPDKRCLTAAISKNSKTPAIASLLSPRNYKSTKKERKEETVNQYMREDVGSSKMGGPSTIGCASLRAFSQARPQREDSTPPRKRQPVLTSSARDRRDGRSMSPSIAAACKTFEKQRKEAPLNIVKTNSHSSRHFPHQ